MTDKGDPGSRRQAAARWFAELQESDLAPEAWAAFTAWEKDPLNAEAFREIEAAVGIIDQLPAGPPGTGEGPKRTTGKGQRRRPGEWLLLAAASLLAVIAVPFLAMSLPPAQDTYRTAVGERREIVLTDGSVVLLNTDTELTASYSMRSRSIQLDHGEALFKVEPSAKPFTVEASGTRTRALGTEFDVRSDTGGVAVTLYKGSVLVSPGTAGGHAEEGVRLAPGERVTVAAGTEPVLGKVDLEAATSWRDGIVRFNGTPLKEAVEEMNRYSATPIRVEDAALASERISGSFPAGEQEAFAESLALTLPLGVEHEHDAIVLVPASD